MNGIDATKDGRTLVVVQSNLGKLFRVTGTGVADEIELGGESVPNGDGLLLDGKRLYVVQNRLNKIARIAVDRRLTSGRILGFVTDPDFDVPTTIDDHGQSAVRRERALRHPADADDTLRRGAGAQALEPTLEGRWAAERPLQRISALRGPAKAGRKCGAYWPLSPGPVAQWIERQASNLRAEVQFLPGPCWLAQIGICGEQIPIARRPLKEAASPPRLPLGRPHGARGPGGVGLSGVGVGLERAFGLQALCRGVARRLLGLELALVARLLGVGALALTLFGARGDLGFDVLRVDERGIGIAHGRTVPGRSILLTARAWRNWQTRRV